MSSQGLDFPAACWVPHPDRLIVACRCQLLAIRAERQAENPVRVSFQVPNVLAGGQVPDLDGLILAGRGQPLAIGTEHHTVHRAGVPLQAQRLRAVRRVPYPDRLIKARRCHAVSVRTERHARDESSVSFQSGKGALGRPAPEVPFKAAQVLVAIFGSVLIEQGDESAHARLFPGALSQLHMGVIHLSAASLCFCLRPVALQTCRPLGKRRPDRQVGADRGRGRQEEGKRRRGRE